MLNERIGPTTARFAVLGASLPHTWSPYIHNSLFDAAKSTRSMSPSPFHLNDSLQLLMFSEVVLPDLTSPFLIRKRLFHIWMKSTALFQLVVQSTQWKFAMAA